MRLLNLSFALVLAAGCGNRNDSLVVVTLSSTGTLGGVAKVHTHAVVGGRTADFELAPGNGATVSTPITYGIDIPHDVSGAISLQVALYDGKGNAMGSGTGSGAIAPGKRADITVHVAGSIVTTSPDMAMPPDMAQPDMVPSVPVDMAQPPPDLSLPPMLTIDTGLQPFGPVTQGHTSATAQFLITNTGTVPAGMPKMSTSGDTGDFTLTSDCNGMVPAMGHCRVSAAFTPQPTSSGAKDAKFTLTAMPGGSVDGEVTGTALVPGKLAMTPDKGSCGSALLGNISTTQATFTVKNSGTTSTGALTVSVTDPTMQFTATGCSGALAGGAMCNVVVSYTAKKRNSSVASIQVNDANDATDVAAASVSATGLAPATVSISPASFTFPSTARSSAGATQDFTVSNGGDVATASLTSSTVTGSGFTRVSDGCGGKPLTPTTPCVVQVQFTPTLTGNNAGTLAIHDSTVTPLASVQLGGVGTPAWTREYSSSSVNNVGSIWSAGDQRHAWAVGDNNTILDRQGDGSWSVDNNGGVPATSTIQQVVGTSATDVWAIAGANYLRSTGNGTWSLLTDSSISYFLSIAAFNVNNIYLLVRLSNNNLAMYQISGTTWTSNSAANCIALYGASPSSMFCSTYVQTCNGLDCSSYGSVALWNGSAWAATAGNKTWVPYATPGWASSATDLYVPGSGARPWHYDGSGFTAVDSSAASDVRSVWGVDSTHVFFVSSAGVALGDGKTWGLPVDPLQKKLSGGSMSGASVTDYYVTGRDMDGGCIYHYH